MKPVLNDGVYVFVQLPDGMNPDVTQPGVVCLFREREGWSLIMEENAAQKAGFPGVFRSAWITLEVNSDLAAVGLTAAFSNALGVAGISCNVVAALRHDHIFVPIGQADNAMTVLRRLQATGGEIVK